MIWRASLLSAALAATACGQSHASRDAGRDAGPDARADTGVRDSVRDSGRDTGVDTGVDAGDTTGPDFVPLSNLPSGCNMWIARHPERIEPYRFEPCFDGRSDCQQLVVDWGDWRDSAQQTYLPHWYAWAHTGEPGIVLTRRRELGFRWTEVIDASDGHVIGAIRWADPPSVGPGVACYIGASGAISATSERLWFGMTPFVPLADYDIHTILVGGQWHDLANLERFDLTREMIGSNSTSEIELGTGWLAIRLSPGQRVGRLDDGVFRMVSPTADVPGIASRYVPVQSYLVYIVLGTVDWELAIAGPDGVPRHYLGGPDQVIGGVAADEEYIAWLEMHSRRPDFTYASRLLRVAHFTPDGAALTVLQELDVGPGRLDKPMVGGGWASIAEDTEQRITHFLRISDGRDVTITPPPGFIFLPRGGYITPTEAGLQVAQQVTTIPRTLFRIPLPTD